MFKIHYKLICILYFCIFCILYVCITVHLQLYCISSFLIRLADTELDVIDGLNFMLVPKRFIKQRKK